MQAASIKTIIKKLKAELTAVYGNRLVKLAKTGLMDARYHKLLIVAFEKLCLISSTIYLTFHGLLCYF